MVPEWSVITAYARGAAASKPNRMRGSTQLRVIADVVRMVRASFLVRGRTDCNTVVRKMVVSCCVITFLLLHGGGEEKASRFSGTPRAGVSSHRAPPAAPARQRRACSGGRQPLLATGQCGGPCRCCFES